MSTEEDAIVLRQGFALPSRKSARALPVMDPVKVKSPLEDAPPVLVKRSHMYAPPNFTSWRPSTQLKVSEIPSVEEAGC